MKSPKPNYYLTSEERQVLQLLANGINSQSIRDQSMIDEETLWKIRSEECKWSSSGWCERKPGY